MRDRDRDKDRERGRDKDRENRDKDKGRDKDKERERDKVFWREEDNPSELTRMIGASLYRVTLPVMQQNLISV